MSRLSRRAPYHSRANNLVSMSCKEGLTMARDLETTFGLLAERVPTGPVGDIDFVLSAGDLPAPPASLDTDRLIVHRRWHGYNADYRADSLWFQASRETYRQLGLLILSVLFHEQPAQVRLAVCHNRSDIRQLIVEYEYPEEDYPGYQSRPHRYCYYPGETARHPWYWTPGGVHAEDLPRFLLTAQDEDAGDETWAARDQVIVCGSDRALVRLAELLLNADRPDNPVVEYQLEGEGGFRGVGIHSAEVQFFLPESLGWDGTL